VIFWINGWEKHRSPFGKVVDGYVVYNFRIWRFSNFIQKFWVWTGQTAIHRTENRADALERAPAPSRAPSPRPDVRALAITSRGARCHVTPSAPLCYLGSRTTGPPPAFPSSLLFPPRLASTRAGHRCRGRPEPCTPGVEAKRSRRPSCHCRGRRLTARHLPH
jgi:hypothetical protein